MSDETVKCPDCGTDFYLDDEPVEKLKAALAVNKRPVVTTSRAEIRAATLAEAIAAVEAVHRPLPDDARWCADCGYSYPCSAIRTLRSLADGGDQ